MIRLDNNITYKMPPTPEYLQLSYIELGFYDIRDKFSMEMVHYAGLISVALEQAIEALQPRSA
mgnify:CR=1 FL=1